MEELDGDSLKRYDKITNTLIDLGYTLKDGYPKKDEEGKLEWVFINSKLEEIFITEHNILDYDYFDSKKWFERQEKNFMKGLTKEFLKEFISESIKNNKK